MNRTLRAEDLASIAVPSQPAVSPDGGRVAYVLRTCDLDGDETVTSLWIVEGEQPSRRLTLGPSDTSPAWSPDGATLAFVRERQLWLLPVAGGEPRQVTTLSLGAGAPLWSPDGSAVAFCAPVDGAPHTERATAPIVSDGVDYRADGVGFLRGARTQIQVLDVVTGVVRPVTHGAQHARNPAWSPDGATLAFTAKCEGDSDLDIHSAVHLVDAADIDASPRVVAFESGLAATVCFAPDGRLIVVGWTGDVRGHARLHVVEPATGAVAELPVGLDRNVMIGQLGNLGAAPQAAGDQVLFCVRDRGRLPLYAVPLAGGEARLVHGGDGHVVGGLSVAGSVAALALATPDSFGEIVTIDLGAGRTTTRTSYGESLADVRLVERVSREFTISDGTRVEGWLVRDASTPGPGPLLVDVHGGPHGAWNTAADEAHLYHQELAAAGWTVLLINPRGSDGYGEAFYDGVFGAWGVADAADFLEPIDELVAGGIADPQRLAVTGYSYGGYMTCYLTSRDDRFAAAVAGGVLADLVSTGGTSDEAHLMSRFEMNALPWRDEDRETLARQSPYTHVDDVTTPTLLLHGVDDLRCPVGQAQQWHHALREQGVPTRLVLYPGASHVFPLTGLPSHRIDYNRRVVDWVQQYAGR